MLQKATKLRLTKITPSIQKSCGIAQLEIRLSKEVLMHSGYQSRMQRTDIAVCNSELELLKTEWAVPRVRQIKLLDSVKVELHQNPLIPIPES